MMSYFVWVIMPMRWPECRIQVAASGADQAYPSLLPITHCESWLSIVTLNTCRLRMNGTLAQDAEMPPVGQVWPPAVIWSWQRQLSWQGWVQVIPDMPVGDGIYTTIDNQLGEAKSSREPVFSSKDYYNFINKTDRRCQCRDSISQSTYICTKTFS